MPKQKNTDKEEFAQKLRAFEDTFIEPETSSVDTPTRELIVQQIERLVKERGAAKRKITPKISQWINRNFRLFSDKELAEFIGCNPKTIEAFRTKKGLAKYETQKSAQTKLSVKDKLLKLGRSGVSSKVIARLDSYTKTTRFQQFVTILGLEESQLFEDQFYELTIDLLEDGDLTRQEINAVIDLDIEYLNQFRLQRKLRVIEEMETANVRMVDMNEKKLYEEALHRSLERTQKMLQNLKVTRKQRLDRNQPRKISIVDLVEAWQKEESRRIMIERAKITQQTLRSEHDRIQDLRGGMAMILGYDPTKNVVDFDEEFNEKEEDFE